MSTRRGFFRQVAALAGGGAMDKLLETVARAAAIDPAADWMIEASYDEAGGELAASRLLGATPRPTALFVANVRAAIGALAAVRRLGLSVPHDVSLVGFHDAPVAMYLDPELTTVKMPLREMGSAATRDGVGIACPLSLPCRNKEFPAGKYHV